MIRKSCQGRFFEKVIEKVFIERLFRDEIERIVGNPGPGAGSAIVGTDGRSRNRGVEIPQSHAGGPVPDDFRVHLAMERWKNRTSGDGCLQIGDGFLKPILGNGIDLIQQDQIRLLDLVHEKGAECFPAEPILNSQDRNYFFYSHPIPQAIRSDDFRYRFRLRNTGRLEQDPFRPEAFPNVYKCVDEFIRQGAADASAGQFDDIPAAIFAPDDRAIDANFSEFVDQDDGIGKISSPMKESG